jgi:hypothetical protein
VPTRTSDPLALLRGTVEDATPLASAGATSGPAGASSSPGAAGEINARTSPVSWPAEDGDDVQAAATSGVPVLVIVIGGLLAAVAVMVGAAVWQNWRTDD